MRYLVYLLLLLAIPAVHASDYVREKKWADEIIPGIVVGEPLYLEARAHRFLAIYTEAPGAKSAVVVVHGLGVHPDWALIGVLRSGLAERGYTTLSVQMPVLAASASAEDYPSTFDEAAERLDRAVAFLREKGYGRIAIVSHSMGSRMSRHYLARDPAAPVAAWVAIGMPGQVDYDGIPVPVLDLYGENDLPAVLQNAGKRGSSLQAVKGSEQMAVPHADHFFTDRDADLVRYVKDYLDRALGG
jgi:pimeloyl-ACP methyl ester carboxylesterase